MCPISHLRTGRTALVRMQAVQFIQHLQCSSKSVNYGRWPILVHSGSGRVAHQLSTGPQQQQQQQQQAAACNPKRNSTFRFRYFTLSHGRCAMKMGTDAMLLGSWSQPPHHTRHVLDVGTGTGVLALMMSQKTQQQGSTIHAIDIDQDSILQAHENFQASPWSERLLVAHCSLQEWVEQCSIKYDLIISNPPFFLRSSKPEESARAAARHADDVLPFKDLAAAAARLLQANGRLCLILPLIEAQCFMAEAEQHGLLMTRLMQVFTKCSDQDPKRLMMQFELLATSASYSNNSTIDGGGGCSTSVVPDSVISPQHPVVQQLVIMQERTSSTSGQAVQVHSEQYQQLTADFHHPDLFKATHGPS